MNAANKTAPLSGWRAGRVKPFSYDDAGTPEGYHCTTCGLSGVKLWRDVHDDRDAYCAACCAAITPRGWKAFTLADVHADGTVADGEWSRSCQIAWKLPYRPTEEGDETWGHGGGDNRSVTWWNSLPLHPTRPMPPTEKTFTTDAGDSCTYVRKDVADGQASAKWCEEYERSGKYLRNQRDKDEMVARLLDSAFGLIWSEKTPFERLYDVNDLLRGVVLLVRDQQTRTEEQNREWFARREAEVADRKKKEKEEQTARRKAEKAEGAPPAAEPEQEQEQEEEPSKGLSHER